MQQERGWIGKLVGGMISRSVRRSFRRVYWDKPENLPPGPILFATNHHGWHDGYLMFHLVKAANRPSLDWISEYDAFPLFRYAGGMPFPPNDAGRRAATVRATIREMSTTGRSLIFFPEMHLHPPGDILPLGRAVEMLAKNIPNSSVLPVSIFYRMDIHERPEVFMRIGDRIEMGPEFLDRLREAMERQLAALRVDAMGDHAFDVLVEGTLDVNERWDFRARFGKK